MTKIPALLSCIFSLAAVSAAFAAEKKVFYQAETFAVAVHRPPLQGKATSRSRLTESAKPVLPGFRFIRNDPQQPFFDLTAGFSLEFLGDGTFAFENVVCGKSECDFQVSSQRNFAWRTYFSSGRRFIEYLTGSTLSYDEQGRRIATGNERMHEIDRGLRRLIAADRNGYEKYKTLLCSRAFRHWVDQIHESSSHGSSTSRKAMVCQWADGEDIKALRTLKSKTITLRLDGKEIVGRDQLPASWRLEPDASDEIKYLPLFLVNTRTIDFPLFFRDAAEPGRVVGSFSVFSEKSYPNDEVAENLLATEPSAALSVGGVWYGPYSPNFQRLWAPLAAEAFAPFSSRTQPAPGLIEAYRTLSDREAAKNLWLRWSPSAPFETMEIEYPADGESEFSLRKISVDCRGRAPLHGFEFCPVTFTYR